MHGRLFAKHVVHWQSLNKNWWPMCDHQMERENWQINTYASTQGTYTSTVTVTVTSTTTKIAATATATATPAIRTCASAKQALTNTHTQHIHSGTLTLKRKQLYSYCWPYLSSCFKVRAAASGSTCFSCSFRCVHIMPLVCIRFTYVAKQPLVCQFICVEQWAESFRIEYSR